MKFDSSLDHYENIRRMREHALENKSPRITWDDIQPEEVDALRRLNATLVAIEERYTAEAAQLNPALDSRTTHVEDTGQGRFHQVRITDGDVGLSDYELELEIEFYLKVTDPEWDEQDENTLWFCESHLSRHSHIKNSEPNEFGFGCVHVDHSEPSSGAPFPQCWLFHQLVDAPLTLRDLLRIGSFWCDLVTTEQRWVLLAPNNAQVHH